MPPDEAGKHRNSPGVANISKFIQLVYASQPFGYDLPTLNGILIDARRCNVRDGVTGALVCRHDIYLQLLEGPADKIEATFNRIERDDRHAGVKLLVNHAVNHRIFASWAMLHDPAPTLIWSKEEIACGILETEPPSKVVSLFENLAQKFGG